MIINTYILLYILVLRKTLAKFTVDDYAVSENCREVYSIETPKYVAYEETYQKRNLFGQIKNKTRINYKLEKHLTHHTKATCCHGYTTYAMNLCIPVCSRSCDPNGICSEPEVCQCNDGYSMDHDIKQCKPVCMYECEYGECTAPNVCTCNEGYRMLPDLVTCKPICDNCANLEYCVEPHVCRCLNGYFRLPNRRSDSEPEDQKCKAVCDKICVNADCVEPNLCRCHDGFANLDDDEFTCEPVCGECIRGFCSAPDKCTCHSGYEPNNIHPNICDPICSQNCENGFCIAPDECVCNNGYDLVEDKFDKTVCQPHCTNPCINGKCLKPDYCFCDTGYESTNNGTQCEPICSQICEMGNCTAPDQCTCFEGYKLSKENLFRCEPICNENCTNSLCTAPDICTCFEGYEKKNETNSTCIIICNCENGFCHETSSTCNTCEEGYNLESYENSTVCKPHCESGCENGLCVKPQLCECYDNYFAENNKSLGSTICVKVCGDDCIHGTCRQETNNCDCFFGWTGKYCDESTVCSLVKNINYNDTLYYSMFNVSEIIMHEPWSGPLCKNECLNNNDIINVTQCVTRSFNETLNLTCFISIDSLCNKHIDVKFEPYEFKKHTEMIALVATITLLSIFGVILFVLRYKNKKKSEVNIMQQPKKNEEDHLIESDGINL